MDSRDKIHRFLQRKTSLLVMVSLCVVTTEIPARFKAQCFLVGDVPKWCLSKSQYLHDKK
jgi:hypothetical protein